MSLPESIELGAGAERIEDVSAVELIERVAALDDPSVVLVAVDPAALGDGGEVDVDMFNAVVSTLVVLGVHHIETEHSQVAKRIFDTYRAITTGNIEVLES